MLNVTSRTNIFVKDINNSNQLSLKFTSSIAVFMLNILENEDESALQTVTGWGFDKQVLSCQHSQVKCSMLKQSNYICGGYQQQQPIAIKIYLIYCCIHEDESVLQTVTGWSVNKQGLSCQHSQVKCS